MKTTMTIRLDEQTKIRLEQLAKATARSKSYLVNNAIEEFIAANEWQVQEIQRALHDADQPGAKFVEHDEVAAWLDTWGSTDEKEPPQCK